MNSRAIRSRANRVSRMEPRESDSRYNSYGHFDQETFDEDHEAWDMEMSRLEDEYMDQRALEKSSEK